MVRVGMKRHSESALKLWWYSRDCKAKTGKHRRYHKWRHGAEDWTAYARSMYRRWIREARFARRRGKLQMVERYLENARVFIPYAR